MPTSGAPQKPPWKQVAGLAFWLCLAPPIGLWKLWREPTLSASAKWRILIYLMAIPLLAYSVLTTWLLNRTLQRLMP